MPSVCKLVLDIIAVIYVDGCSLLPVSAILTGFCIFTMGGKL